MSIEFKVRTVKEMKEFIYFLSKTNINPCIQDKGRFYYVLYEAIKENAIEPMWMRSRFLIEYLEEMCKIYNNNYVLCFTQSVKDIEAHKYNILKYTINSQGC